MTFNAWTRKNGPLLVGILILLLFFNFLATQLQPVNVELHAEENREDHKTDSYEMQDLVIRRGQEFKISVTFDRSYDSKRDQIFLQFVTGVVYS